MPSALAGAAVLVAVEAMRVGGGYVVSDPEVFLAEIVAVLIGRRRWDAEVGIGGVTVRLGCRWSRCRGGGCCRRGRRGSGSRRGGCSRSSGRWYGRHEGNDRRCRRDRRRGSFRRRGLRHRNRNHRGRGTVAPDPELSAPSALLSGPVRVDAKESATTVDVHLRVAHRDHLPAEVRATRQRHIREKPLEPIPARLRAVADERHRLALRKPLDGVRSLNCTSLSWPHLRRVDAENANPIALTSRKADEDRVAVNNLGDYRSCCH